MRWEELIATPVRRDEDGVLVVLEEIDDDTRTAVFRRAGESFAVQADEAPASVAEPQPGVALEVKVLQGEVVEDEPNLKVPGTFKVAAAGAAAAGLAWLATRRRR